MNCKFVLINRWIYYSTRSNTEKPWLTSSTLIKTAKSMSKNSLQSWRTIHNPFLLYPMDLLLSFPFFICMPLVILFCIPSFYLIQQPALTTSTSYFTAFQGINSRSRRQQSRHSMKSYSRHWVGAEVLMLVSDSWDVLMIRQATVFEMGEPL